MRLADSDKEAGSFKTEDRIADMRRGNASHSSVEAAGIRDGQVDGMTVDQGDRGRLPVGKLDGEPHSEVRADEAKFLPADLVEQAGAVAQDDRHARNRIPDHVAKAAQAGEWNGDLIPV